MGVAAARAMEDIWPDWSGEPVAIIASGPSVKKADVALLEGRITTLAIKKNVELAPWAEVVYGCDFPWWRSVYGLMNHKGLRMAWDPRVAERYGAIKVDIAQGQDEMLFKRLGSIGSGGNSGFQALNLTAQFGADRILLLGFDMQDRSNPHWYGRNGWQNANNPCASNFRRWIPAFSAAAPVLRDRGIDVINASPISDLKCFRRQGVEATLKEWGLW